MNSTEKSGAAAAPWKFTRSFWVANGVELLERSAYYAVFIAITLYLTQVVGFNDIWAAWIGGGFSAGLYFLPPFAGAVADKIGFRKAVILAFSLLTVGYFTLGALPYKAVVPPALVVLMIGGSFIKSIITGTVALNTTTETRARGYSIFYGMVNVGSFLGKTFAFPLRLEWGVESINFYSAGMTLLALAVVWFFYTNATDPVAGRSIGEIWRSFLRLLKHGRLVALILIVSGFWIIQQQLYATMPKYVLRTVGAHSAPEWIANVNPLMVVACVVLVTNLMRKVSAVGSMMTGMFLMPVSALVMASSMLFGGTTVDFFGLFSAHIITVAMIVGIMIQGLAECFISPRYLEYFSLQAPKGEEGLYLGFSHLHSFVASILGFGISGYLLTIYCPDPRSLTAEQFAHAYDRAHYIWFYFAGIAAIAGIALLIYRAAVARIDSAVHTQRE